MRQGNMIAAGIAVVMLSAFTAACTSGPTRESTGEYVDSSVISNKVRAAIVKDPTLSIFNIDVTTFRNTVQLSGFVDSQAQKDRAAQLARNVAGVTEVHNNISIKPAR